MGVNMMLVFMIEREEIFIDTSANFAIVNKKDIDYQIAVKLELMGSGWNLEFRLANVTILWVFAK